jgi:hypothetical protein
LALALQIDSQFSTFKEGNTSWINSFTALLSRPNPTTLYPVLVNVVGTPVSCNRFQSRAQPARNYRLARFKHVVFALETASARLIGNSHFPFQGKQNYYLRK